MCTYVQHSIFFIFIYTSIVSEFDKIESFTPIIFTSHYNFLVHHLLNFYNFSSCSYNKNKMCNLLEQLVFFFSFYFVFVLLWKMAANDGSRGGCHTIIPNNVYWRVFSDAAENIYSMCCGK